MQRVRLELLGRLIGRLKSQNILVWDDGLSEMWDPSTGRWCNRADKR
jgi:hypothetical protein